MNSEKATIALVVLGDLVIVLSMFEPMMGGSALIVGTGVEDLLTSGVGIADGPLSVATGIATIAGVVAGIGNAIVQPKACVGGWLTSIFLFFARVLVLVNRR